MPARIIDRDRWSRLPQWAQDELSRLARDVEIAEAKLAIAVKSNNGDLTVTAHGGYPAALGCVANQLKVKVVDEW